MTKGNLAQKKCRKKMARYMIIHKKDKNRDFEPRLHVFSYNVMYYQQIKCFLSIQ